MWAWRADARTADWGDTRVVDPKTDQVYECLNKNELSTCNWSPESFNKLKKMIAEQVPEGDNQSNAMDRINQNLDPDPTKAPQGESDMAKVWKAHSSACPATDACEKQLAAIWQKTGCAAEGTPYVLRKLLVDLAGPLLLFARKARCAVCSQLPSSTRRIVLERTAYQTMKRESSKKSTATLH